MSSSSSSVVCGHKRSRHFDTFEDSSELAAVRSSINDDGDIERIFQ